MSDQHRATPEQWDDVQYYGNPYRSPRPRRVDSCILELRSRIAALEDAANHFPGATKMVPATAGGLVERVAQAIATDSGQRLHSSVIAEWSGEARAAILAVAEWLDAQEPVSLGFPSACLREEVERG